MAEHRVPQDVEADDKLIGPFSFRQFVYLMIAAAAGFLAFILWQIAVPLAIIPSPAIAFFLVLALPLRKDQPMEVYLAALVQYYFKPRVRIWRADGEQPLVEISNPIVDDSPKTKDLAGDEVSRRLSFLANLSDTQGWSTRGLTAPANSTNLNDDYASAAVGAEDVLEDTKLKDSFNSLLEKSRQKERDNAVSKMKRAAINQAAVTVTSQPPTVAAPNITSSSNLPTYNNQSVGSLVPEEDNTPDLQLTLPQPDHNKQLQASPTKLPTLPMAAELPVNKQPLPTKNQDPVSRSTPPVVTTASVKSTTPTKTNSPISPSKNNDQLTPPARSTTVVVKPKPPVAPVVKPVVLEQPKPGIIKSDDSKSRSKVEPSVESESIIDIKLH